MVDYFRALWGRHELVGALSVWMKNKDVDEDRRTEWIYADDDWKLPQLVEAHRDNYDVYIGLGVREKKLTSQQRGKKQDVVAITALWADIDYWDPETDGAHSTGGDLLPQGIGQALEVAHLALTPSLVVKSGAGIHAYYLLNEPITNMEEAENLLKRLNHTMAHRAKEQMGLESAVDVSCAEVARVLRVPGSFHHKSGTPRPVELTNDGTGDIYTVEDVLDSTLPLEEIPTTGARAGTKKGPVQGRRKGELPDALIPPIIEGCGFMREFKENAASQAEPEWYAALNILSRCENGREKAHEWGQDHPQYNAKETDAKLEHASSAIEKHSMLSCGKIFEITKGKFCRTCDHWTQIKSPISLGMKAEKRAENVVDIALKSVSDGGDPFETILQNGDVLTALCVLEDREPGAFAAYREKMKLAKVKKQDLKAAMDNQRIKNRREQMALAKEESKNHTLEDVFPDIPQEGLRKPLEWTLNEAGIRKYEWNEKRQEEEVYRASQSPVIISGRLVNIDTLEEKIRLHFKRDGRWKKIHSLRGNVFQRSRLVDLGNMGLPVSSESAALLIRYLEDFEEMNDQAIPLIQTTPRMGWVGDEEYFPGAQGETLLDVEEGMEGTAAGVRQEGTLEKWLEGMATTRERPIPRFMLAASLAAPLLKVIRHRNAWFHVWCRSGAGKSAALHGALSCWGYPETLKTSFNTTKVGLERRAAFFNDFPLGIDERQQAGKRQELLDELVYMVSNGQSRGRGTKGGGIQKQVSWRTITLSNGEEPLSDESSMKGVKNRVMEVKGEPFATDKDAQLVYHVTENHYGHAGPAFIRYLIEKMKDDPEQFKRDHAVMVETLTAKHPGRLAQHISAVSLVAVADLWASQWLWDISEWDALQQAEEMAGAILEGAATEEEADDATRSWEYIRVWIQQNMAGITRDPNGHDRGQRYGWKEQDAYYIFSPVVTKALKEGGFSPRRATADWVDKGWIKPDLKGKTSHTMRPPAESGLMPDTVRVMIFPRNTKES